MKGTSFIHSLQTVYLFFKLSQRITKFEGKGTLQNAELFFDVKVTD